jgi:hypothetical protein
MNRGYVNLWRKSLDSGWLKNHTVWILWSYCLLKASHKEHDVIIGWQTVHLLPGQFVFGLLKASNETGLTMRQIRTALAFLKKAGNVTIKTTNKFSVITIINWGIYQGGKPGERQAKRQAGDKQATTYNNGNNGKNKYSCPQKAIVDLFHARLPELAKVKVWSEKRQAALRARWSQAVPNNNGLKSNCIEWWAGYFDYVRESDFLMGRVEPTPGKGPFEPNLEWLVIKKNFINILEGKYHRRGA